jgi:hypothetical protein
MEQNVKSDDVSEAHDSQQSTVHQRVAEIKLPKRRRLTKANANSDDNNMLDSSNTDEADIEIHADNDADGTQPSTIEQSKDTCSTVVDVVTTTTDTTIESTAVATTTCTTMTASSTTSEPTSTTTAAPTRTDIDPDNDDADQEYGLDNDNDNDIDGHDDDDDDDDDDELDEPEDDEDAGTQSPTKSTAASYVNARS